MCRNLPDRLYWFWQDVRDYERHEMPWPVMLLLACTVYMIALAVFG